MRSTGVSLASLWRPLYPLIILVVCLVCIFLLKPLDLGNLKAWYKAFYMFYYLLYSCCVVRLASLFYPKAYRDR
jgi:Tfp pilus assembly protein PilO